VLAVEEVRASLVPASDLYGLGRVDDARVHLAAARRAYAPLAPRVRARNRRLGRELGLVFPLLERWMDERAPPDRVRERITPVRDQLLDGVLETLVPTAVRVDPAVQAAVVRRLIGGLEREYWRASPPPEDAGARLALQSAYGHLSRSQAGVQAIEQELGAVLEDIAMPLSTLRFEAFAGGLGPPPPGLDPPPPAKPPPPERVAGLLAEVRRGLDRRFRP
jgi:hypothetical protein